MTTPTEKRILAAIPTNWCDPLLTGPKAVIGKPPYDCRDIERLLNGIRARADAAAKKGGNDE
mgnify:CR=1 FL=1